MRYQWIVVVVGLLLAQTGQAKTYRCEDVDGDITFQDQPCQSGDGKTVDVETQKARTSGTDGGTIGSFTTDNTTLTLRDHAVHWDAESGELIVILTPTALSKKERKRLRNGEDPFDLFHDKPSPDPSRWEDSYPYCELTLRFDPADVAVENLSRARFFVWSVPTPNYNLNVGPSTGDAKADIDELRMRNGELSLSYRGEYTGVNDDTVEHEWSIRF